MSFTFYKCISVDLSTKTREQLSLSHTLFYWGRDGMLLKS